MTQKYKLWILTLFVVVLVILGIYIYYNGSHKEQDILNEDLNKNNLKEDSLIFFYGKGCPHCALVEEFMKQNNVLSKINIVEKEVYYNKKNASELAEKARICGINTNEIGVPFLWDGKNCIVGDTPIINFLNEKLNQNNSNNLENNN